VGKDIFNEELQQVIVELQQVIANYPERHT